MYKVDKNVAGRRTRSILHNNEKCVLHVRNEVKIDTFVNCVLLHFKRGLFSEMPLDYELLDSVYAISSVLDSTVSFIQSHCN
jgi:hypothetical protein